MCIRDSPAAVQRAEAASPDTEELEEPPLSTQTYAVQRAESDDLDEE